MMEFIVVGFILGAFLGLIIGCVLGVEVFSIHLLEQAEWNRRNPKSDERGLGL